jgi:hypothetical protein
MNTALFKCSNPNCVFYSSHVDKKDHCEECICDDWDRILFIEKENVCE